MSTTEDPHGHASAEIDALTLPWLAARCAIGGVLMGLANLVPGISGGTMLLAAGVYPAFINAIAELTTLRIRLRPIFTLAAIAGSAGLAILLLAGAMKTLVIEQRWAMYSLFIGLTLGGVPLVWRLARPATPAVWLSAALSFALMALMSLEADGRNGEAGGVLLLFVAGLAGAGAMILPGVSGGYLLLLLGQYEPILGAIDDLKTGLLGEDGSGFDLSLVLQSAEVVVPVGVGVVLGVVGVSNLLKWLLERYEKATLGVLLGLLVGAVVGLYPFRTPTPPEAGFVHRGTVLSPEEVASLSPKYWPVERFDPSAGQVAGALGLLLAGLGATWVVDRLGASEPGSADAS